MKVKIKLKVCEFIEIANGFKQLYKIESLNLSQRDNLNAINFLYYATNTINKLQFERVAQTKQKTFNIDANQLFLINDLIHANDNCSPYLLAINCTINNQTAPQISRVLTGFNRGLI